MYLKLAEALQKINEQEEKINSIKESLDVPRLTLRLSELNMKMSEPTFWDDPESARELSQEAAGLEDRLKNLRTFEEQLSDIQVLAELSEDDEDTEKQIYKDYLALDEALDQYLLQLHLDGPYDANNAILNLHVGVGGTDAQDFTQMLMRMYLRWAEKKGFKTELLNQLDGEEAGIREAVIKITGEYAYGYLRSEKGIHRLVRISPFNTNGKRQTSFASVEVLPELKQNQDVQINPDDLKIDTYRSGGAGGQHVNKTESAVRITHLPTGIIVQCQNERSQHNNREVAMDLLKSKLVELKERAHMEKIEELTGEQKDMSWGSQIRSYVFNPYQMVKDHRTLAETTDVYGVLDGNIDLFINAYLQARVQGDLQE
ncbi:peptide chain release factor 2 [Proteiniclasticum sp. QWL-01]|uniref:peptide chain release factor 2 n=1 Tax=Proteiniclasticum sp. QWL-01 TaxID=3036945 RepID=UPI0021F92AF3|nr:peptide chain release factor 2 [Proteiniclasticum sp. QWL-01]UUM13215.1 peptide chain release factor 2 [Clostridiaceae bacterium HFYG-1003]WFF71641.1 peptide chain release factor 2 [Proteiniclasticum sp. QWL-01]